MGYHNFDRIEVQYLGLHFADASKLLPNLRWYQPEIHLSWRPVLHIRNLNLEVMLLTIVKQMSSEKHNEKSLSVRRKSDLLQNHHEFISMNISVLWKWMQKPEESLNTSCFCLKLHNLHLQALVNVIKDILILLQNATDIPPDLFYLDGSLKMGSTVIFHSFKKNKVRSYFWILLDSLSEKQISHQTEALILTRLIDPFPFLIYQEAYIRNLHKVNGSRDLKTGKV